MAGPGFYAMDWDEVPFDESTNPLPECAYDSGLLRERDDANSAPEDTAYTGLAVERGTEDGQLELPFFGDD